MFESESKGKSSESLQTWYGERQHQDEDGDEENELYNYGEARDDDGTEESIEFIPEVEYRGEISDGEA